MTYDCLYEMFKEEFPEGLSFFKAAENKNLIDENDGMHVIFGTIVVPYILYSAFNGEKSEVKKIFAFLEKMAADKDTRITEVLDFTVLEQLIDRGNTVLKQCKQYMGENTLRHCEKIEAYFWPENQ